MIRTVFKPDLIANKQKIAFKFILGSPPDDDWRYALEQEECVLDHRLCRTSLG